MPGPLFVLAFLSKEMFLVELCFKIIFPSFFLLNKRGSREHKINVLVGQVLDLSLPQKEKSHSADDPTGASFPLIFTFHSEFSFLKVSYPQRDSFGRPSQCSFHVSEEKVLASRWKVTKSETLSSVLLRECWVCLCCL